MAPLDKESLAKMLMYKVEGTIEDPIDVYCSVIQSFMIELEQYKYDKSFIESCRALISFWVDNQFTNNTISDIIKENPYFSEEYGSLV